MAQGGGILEQRRQQRPLRGDPRGELWVFARCPLQRLGSDAEPQDLLGFSQGETKRADGHIIAFTQGSLDRDEIGDLHHRALRIGDARPHLPEPSLGDAGWAADEIRANPQPSLMVFQVSGPTARQPPRRERRSQAILGAMTLQNHEHVRDRCRILGDDPVAILAHHRYAVVHACLATAEDGARAALVEFPGQAVVDRTRRHDGALGADVGIVG